MNRKLFFILFFLTFLFSYICSPCLSAQRSLTGTYEKLDDAKYGFEYVIYENDKELNDNIQKHFKLLVGDKYLCFCDARKYQGDSIFSKPEAKKLTQQEGFAIAMRYYSGTYPEIFYVNLNDSTYEYLTRSGEYIGYKDKLPKLKWELLDTVLVNPANYPGMTLKKAKTNFGGRTWYAWYNPNISLPYGPYFFGGLPGLIFSLWDENKDFLIGLLPRFDLKVDNIQKSTKFRVMLPRDKFYKTLWRNYKEGGLGESLSASGMVPSNAPKNKPRRLHYVPLIK